MNAHLNHGRRWVHCYFLPQINRIGFSGRPLRILSLWPDDNSEAQEFVNLGHSCEVCNFLPDSVMPSSESSFDIILTGRFPKYVFKNDRNKAVNILHSLLRLGGGLLLAVGNRLCPVDLSRNAPLIHSQFNYNTFTMNDIRNYFLSPAGPFQAIERLPVEGHFGWHRLGPLHFLGRIFDSYWKNFVKPSRPILYESPLNPIFLLWISK